MSFCISNTVKYYKIISLILQEHTGRVFRLQFDEFQIVSSSHDDTILIWDFLNCNQDSSGTDTNNAAGFRNNLSVNQIDTRSPSRKY